MSYLTLYLITLTIFLFLDFLGLRYLIGPLFEREASHLLAENLRVLPAVLFYAFYIGCVVYFVSAPALAQNWPLAKTAATAALLGAMAYGTYEFTNLATLNGWSWRMLVTDLSWGTGLTGVSAGVGVAIQRAMS